MKAGKVESPLTRTVIECRSPAFKSATTIMVLSVKRALHLGSVQRCNTWQQLESSVTARNEGKTAL